MTRNDKWYTLEEAQNIINDRKAGKSYSHIKLDYGRSKSAVYSLIHNYNLFQQGNRKFISGRMRKIYEKIDTGNNHAVVAETQNPTSLQKLDLAFEALQKTIVEVIDEEVQRRAKDWVERATVAETELAKYKDAAQQSSVVGLLRRKWGIAN